MTTLWTIVLMAALPAAAQAPAPDLFERLADPGAKPYRAYGQGTVTDASHPKHPGDFLRADVVVRLQVHPEPGEALFAIDSGDSANRSTDRYYLRRGRIFQLDDRDQEIVATALGDVDAATVAALHPALVAEAVRERRESLRVLGPGRWELAWNDALWTIRGEPKSGRIVSLERRVHHDLFGDGVETVMFSGWQGGTTSPGRVVVTAYGRETAHLDFESVATDTAVAVPMGERGRDHGREVLASTITLHEVAPHLFTIDLDSLETRVVVAEFADHVVVLEGAYNSQVCDKLAAAVRARLKKPVRYFAFSHLHGQYVGGTRSWVHEGATVLVPPTTAPLITQVVKARNDLRPDALARDPKPLHVETIKESRKLEDATNALEIYNVESGHTDEYLIFYFPRQKVLLTGDLLFYRPGKPLTGRSKQLCETVAKLKLDVDTYVATWPLSGYGTKNVVTADEMREACAPGK